MSYADERFIQNCRDILTNGVWDTELEVRPHWEDGTPAHTVKKFGIINRKEIIKYCYKEMKELSALRAQMEEAE